MTERSILLTIESESDLHRWLATQQMTQRTGGMMPSLWCDYPELDESFQDGGASCLKLIQHWDAGYRYVDVAFRGGIITFSSLPACVHELGVVVAVEIADRHRFDLGAVCRGYL